MNIKIIAGAVVFNVVLAFLITNSNNTTNSEISEKASPETSVADVYQTPSTEPIGPVCEGTYEGSYGGAGSGNLSIAIDKDGTVNGKATGPAGGALKGTFQKISNSIRFGNEEFSYSGSINCEDGAGEGSLSGGGSWRVNRP